MRRRIARQLPVIFRCGLVALGTVNIVIACIAGIWSRDYALGLVCLGSALCQFGWAIAHRLAEGIAQSRDDWAQSAADWQAIAEDRRR